MRTDFYIWPVLAMAVAGALVLSGLQTVWATGDREHTPAEERLCRSIAIVLNAPDTWIRVITSAMTLSGDVLIVQYVVDAEGKRSSGRTLACGLGPEKVADTGLRRIIAVTHDGRPLGPARLAFLQRYWLKTDEARQFGAKLPAFGER